MCETKIRPTRTADITMKRGDLSTALPISKQHPLHPKISSRPESFEFELSDRPSVLIFSTEGHSKTQGDLHMARFCRFLQNDPASRTDFVGSQPDVEANARSSLHDHESDIFQAATTVSEKTVRLGRVTLRSAAIA